MYFALINGIHPTTEVVGFLPVRIVTHFGIVRILGFEIVQPIRIRIKEYFKFIAQSIKLIDYSPMGSPFLPFSIVTLLGCRHAHQPILFHDYGIKDIYRFGRLDRSTGYDTSR